MDARAEAWEESGAEAALPRDPDTGWALPCPGTVTQRFGENPADYPQSPVGHPGIDVAAPTGTPVRSPVAGRVVQAGPLGNYGLCVTLDIGHGGALLLAHLATVERTPGEELRAGARVGTVGSTGRSTGPHVHVEARHAGAAVDPAPLLLAAAGAWWATVTAAEGLNLRAAPSLTAPVRTVLPAAAPVLLPHAGWYPAVAGALGGWLWGAHLRLQGSAPAGEIAELWGIVAAARDDGERAAVREARARARLRELGETA
jgi:hypothetical protein